MRDAENIPTVHCPHCDGEGLSGEFVPESCGEGEDTACEPCKGTGRLSLPWEYEVCDRCRGRGVQCKLGAMTGDEYREACYDDEDFPENYKSGMYDEPCGECRGRRVVPVVDRGHCAPALLDAYDDEQRELAECDAIYAAERRMGA